MARYEEYLWFLGHKKCTADTLLEPYRNEMQALEAKLKGENSQRDNLLNDLKFKEQENDKLSKELAEQKELLQKKLADELAQKKLAEEELEKKNKGCFGLVAIFTFIIFAVIKLGSL